MILCRGNTNERIYGREQTDTVLDVSPAFLARASRDRVDSRVG